MLSINHEFTMINKKFNRQPNTKMTNNNIKPLIVINFKTYPEATGINALKLAQIIDRVQRKTNIDIIIAVQPTDIALISSHVNVPVYAQHIDPFPQGRNTGFILPEAILSAGAKGTLLNHSEHRIRIDLLEESIKRAKELGLKVITCANDPLMVLSIATFKPDYIAYEPPELIAGNVSVSESKSDEIQHAIRLLEHFRFNIPLLVGAGVKKNKDLKLAMDFGAKGVLIASGIVKAKDPEKALLDLLNGFY